MTDLTILPSARVRLTRLLALAGLSPAQAVEVGAGLLAAVDEQLDPSGGWEIDAVAVGTDGRVVIVPVAPDGEPPAAERRSPTTSCRVAAVLEEVAAASRGRRGVGGPVTDHLLDGLDRALVELPVAGLSAARERLEEETGAAIDRREVRAELGALVRALTESPGSAMPGSAAPTVRPTEHRPEAPDQVGSARAVRTRLWTWLLSVAVLAAVVALEVVLLHDDVTADVHLLLEAGRSGSTAPALDEPDGWPLTPPAPPAAGPVAGVDLRPLVACTPGDPCTVRVLLRVLPGTDPLVVSWSYQLTDLCTGVTDTAPGGSLTAPAGAQDLAAVDIVPLPAHRAVAVVAVTDRPAAAAAPPVLVGSCASDVPTA